MDLGSAESKPSPPFKAPTLQTSYTVPQNPGPDAPSQSSASGISTWAKILKPPQLFVGTKDESQSESSGKSPFSRLTSGLGLRSSPKDSQPEPEDSPAGASTAVQPGLFNSLTKGLVDSSKSAVKAVQVKARHAVSQNKRRYQEGGFDLDLTYITENIIAMGFPAGDKSSGIFGYVEGFYRNNMEEVIRFFETRHKNKYKVYNLCSEGLYDASLFAGKVACFPFDDHNCPPILLITLFCLSASSWLKEDIENVVVVHCKAGMARTGLMISSLLLYLKFFPTAEESIDYYNQKRCIDGKGLVLPSQIRYVKYFEHVLMYFNGEDQPGRRVMLRGVRLHQCPYWIRPSITVSDHNGVLFSTKEHPSTKDLSPEDYWFSAPKKGIMVFALPGEPGLTELAGDFKVHFHDSQGDFYCWLNTTMIENRKMLNTNELDGFDKRKQSSPGFQVEVVLADYNGPVPTTQADPTVEKSVETSAPLSVPQTSDSPASIPIKNSENSDKDDEVSDKKAEESGSSKSKVIKEVDTKKSSETSDSAQIASLSQQTEQVSLDKTSSVHSNVNTVPSSNVSGREGSDFKAMAADASVFTFGDEEDYESE